MFNSQTSSDRMPMMWDGFSCDPMALIGSPDLRASFLTAIAEDGAGVGMRAVSDVGRCLVRMRGHELPTGMVKATRSTLGHDFSDVCVHVGPQAEAVLTRFGARACCLANHILIADDVVRTETTAAALLHELAHLMVARTDKVIRCWNATEHASLSDTACTAFRGPMLAVAAADGVSWLDFIRGIRNASSNMDFRGRAARIGSTVSYARRLLGTSLGIPLGGAKGEGPPHGEGLNYTTSSMAANRRMNLAEQASHVNLAVREYVLLGKVPVLLPTHRSGPLGPTLGGVSFMEREWLKSLANALHVAQDRGSHREGTEGFGHDDPRCATGWSPDNRAHDHSMGKGWERCSEAAYNQALNFSFDAVHDFLVGVKRRTGATFMVAVPARRTTVCP